jgi:uncharacterized cupredoxin-like copper-binding protein
MNTSKQVNAMIGFLFLAFLVFSAYYAWEPRREQVETKTQLDTYALRGADLFVKNCRTCHGLEGKGTEEGGVAPKLNNPAFLILGKDNEYGLPPTPAGDVKAITQFLTDTIACGRVNTFMPTWSQQHGGSLQPLQIDYIVSMIEQGRFDLVTELGAITDKTTGLTRKDIVATDPSQLAVNKNNCGQYAPDTASAFRARDPFATAPAAAATPSTAATSAPPTSGPPPAGSVPVDEAEFSVKVTGDGTAGKITFAVKNGGQIQHNFRAIKSDLAQDKLPQAAGVVDEKAVNVVAKIEAIDPGKTQTAQGDFTAGNYVLICNVAGHYQLGMHTAFVVK